VKSLPRMISVSKHSIFLTHRFLTGIKLFAPPAPETTMESRELAPSDEDPSASLRKQVVRSVLSASSPQVATGQTIAVRDSRMLCYCALNTVHLSLHAQGNPLTLKSLLVVRLDGILIGTEG
jgi:hypothetical protein